MIEMEETKQMFLFATMIRCRDHFQAKIKIIERKVELF